MLFRSPIQDTTGNTDEYYGSGYDSPDDPAYMTYPDYWSVGNGSEVRHIATSVKGSSEWASEYILLLLFGGLLGDLKHSSDSQGSGGSDGSGGSKDQTQYHYATNGDGTHRKYTTDPKKFTSEKCTYDSTGKCIHCGYVYKATGDTVPSTANWTWPRTYYPQVMGYTRSGWANPPRNTYGNPTPPGTPPTPTNTTGTPSPTTGTAGQLLGGLPGTDALTAPDATLSATPTTGVTVGTVAAPATGTVALPVTVLPNTGDVAAGLDAFMSVAAVAGAALTAQGFRRAAAGHDSKETAEEPEEQED